MKTIYIRYNKQETKEEEIMFSGEKFLQYICVLIDGFGLRNHPGKLCSILFVVFSPDFFQSSTSAHKRKWGNSLSEHVIKQSRTRLEAQFPLASRQYDRSLKFITDLLSQILVIWTQEIFADLAKP